MKGGQKCISFVYIFNVREREGGREGGGERERESAGERERELGRLNGRAREGREGVGVGHTGLVECETTSCY